MRWMSEYILLATGASLVAMFLGLWQLFEKRARSADMEPADRAFFWRQDLRRWVGIGMMFLLAVGIFSAGRWDAANAADSGRDLVRVLTVFGLIVLILGLLALALFDAMATFRYARRQSRDLAREHAAIMRELIRHAGGADRDSRSHETKQGAAEG